MTEIQKIEVLDNVKRVNDLDIPPFLKPIIKNGEDVGCVEKYIQENRLETIFNCRIIDRDSIPVNTLEAIENGVYMLSGDDIFNKHRYIEKPLFSVGQNLFSESLQKKIYSAVSVSKDFYESLSLYKLEDFEIFTVPARSCKYILENKIQILQTQVGIWKDSWDLVPIQIKSSSFSDLIKNNPKTKGLFTFSLGVKNPEFKNRWGVTVGKYEMKYLELADLISFEYVNENEILLYFLNEQEKDESGNFITQVMRLEISKYKQKYFDLLERLINLANNSKPSKVQGIELVEVEIDLDSI